MNNPDTTHPIPSSRADMNRLLGLLAAALLLAPAGARAGGFSVSEMGSIPSGRGGAAAALARDSSVVFFNPANIARLEGVQLQLGASALLPRWEHTSLGDDPVTTRSEAGVIPPPALTATWNLGDGGFGTLAAGLGVYAPYGSTFGWPEGWEGREELQKISLSVFEIAPALAWRPHEKIAVGASFRYLPSSVYMKKAVRFGGEQEGTVELAGSGSGMGAAAGVTFLPTDGLAFGFAWRSQATLKMTGQSDFEFPAPFDPKAVDRDVRTEIPLPHNFRLGFAWQLTSDLDVSADVEYQLWSVFEELAITFENPDGTEEVSSSRRDSQDSFLVHVGGEYRLSPSFAVRAGYLWDQRTLPEETVNPAPPDSDKHIVSLGASYYAGPLGVHAHFSNVFFAPRTSTTSSFPGEWSGGWAGGTMAYMAGLSATYEFDLGAAPPASTVAPAAN